MERWSGKTAVVTGASGGIGSAISSTLAGAGLVVVGLDTKLPDNLSTAPAGDGTVEFRKCDLSVLKEIEAAFAWVESQRGGTDVLVNCAGFSSEGHITSVGNNTLSDEDISMTFDVNIKAMVMCTRHGVASMKGRGFDGHIVNINSIAGHYIPLIDSFNVYSSSKHAVTSFTGSLLNELAFFGSKIKTTSISPGLTKTNMSAGLVGSQPVLQPRDVAEAVVYVLSTPAHVNITELTIQPVAEIRL